MRAAQDSWNAKNIEFKRAAGRRTYYNNKDKRGNRRGGVARYDPSKKAARNKIQNLVRRGKLLRQPCSECNEPNAEMHHPDYSRPFDVVWLCKRHHGALHRKYSEEANELRKRA